jgi:glucokinase
VIGVDVGGTKVLAAVADREGRLLRQHELPTPTESQDALVAGLETAVEPLLDDAVAALAFGVPSRVDQETGVAHGSVNIPLQELRLRDLMSSRFALPVEIENDANAAALAEWTLGAGRGSSNMVMLTLGTGVGGGVVIERRLYRGWSSGTSLSSSTASPARGAARAAGISSPTARAWPRLKRRPRSSGRERMRTASCSSRATATRGHSTSWDASAAISVQA